MKDPACVAAPEFSFPIKLNTPLDKEKNVNVPLTFKDRDIYC